MGERVIHVMTHDSIGLGEDGPTHQPVEHLAALRAIPNLLVFRPCDTIETIECWQLALAARACPSVLALTRQNLPLLRSDADARNRCATGAYELLPAEGGTLRSPCLRQVPRSQSRSKRARSWPRAASRRAWCRCRASSFCLAHRNTQRRAIIGDAPVKVAIEAAVRQGWDAIIGSDGVFVGMTGFRRQCALQGTLHPVRHYARQGGRGCAVQIGQALSSGHVLCRVLSILPQK